MNLADPWGWLVVEGTILAYFLAVFFFLRRTQKGIPPKKGKAPAAGRKLEGKQGKMNQLLKESESLSLDLSQTLAEKRELVKNLVESLDVDGCRARLIPAGSGSMHGLRVLRRDDGSAEKSPAAETVPFLGSPGVRPFTPQAETVAPDALNFRVFEVSITASGDTTLKELVPPGSKSDGTSWGGTLDRAVNVLVPNS